MDARYSGPDTDGSKVPMLGGIGSKRFFSQCVPAIAGPPLAADAPPPPPLPDYGPFTMCMFRWTAGSLSRTPRVGDAVALGQMTFVGKGSVPIVDMHDLANFRQYVPGTPDGNYVWAIYGALKVVVPGSYNLCISSDDGCAPPSPPPPQPHALDAMPANPPPSPSKPQSAAPLIPRF
jgi:hypothetical protein